MTCPVCASQTKWLKAAWVDLSEEGRIIKEQWFCPNQHVWETHTMRNPETKCYEVVETIVIEGDYAGQQRL